MEPTTLAKLMEEAAVTLSPDGLVLEIRSDWVVSGEDHLSYTTLMRLVECCREHHWQKDVLPWCGEDSVDATCKSLSATFLHPVQIGSTISITYRVSEVRRKGYRLNIEIRDTASRLLRTEAELVMVFWDTATGIAGAPPEAVLGRLTQLQRNTEHESGEVT